MTIDTQQSISGFIATQPRLSVGENGVSRFHARVGIEHARQEPTFHDLAIFRKTAEEAAARFRKGDRFVASGRIHEYTYEKDGQQVPAEEFIASRVGHDLARTRYEVDRTPRRPSVDHDAPSPDDLGHDAATRAQATHPTRASV
jgi:single-stranded DNA-binding protein